MRPTKEATAFLSDDGARCVFERGSYRIAFPVAQLPEWIAFYRRMCDRKGRRYANHYAASLAALEGLREA